ncbi:hypothetical protein PHAVU_009G054050 [Phaseolus vulgaris]
MYSRAMVRGCRFQLLTVQHLLLFLYVVPKIVGRQLFSRYLLNILLHKYAEVAYFDTDVGQPEFTPPAFLSLTVVHKVTPDLTVPCLKTPERCLFFGDVSSKRDPSTYLSYVFAISDYYQKEYCISEKGEILVMSSCLLL